MPRRQSLILWSGAVLALLGAWYWGEPHFWLLAMEWSETPQELGQAADRLVACGDRAVGPVIARIQARTPYSKTTCFLPGVLVRRGAPAHHQLLEAIDRTVGAQQSWLIDTLQRSFGDYSRIDRCLALAQERDNDFRLRLSLRERFGLDVPDPVIQGRLNPKFIAWYDTRSARGELPAREGW
jgi:hypothetical protein